jgi:uncharacterized protein (TIGR03086 family)
MADRYRRRADAFEALIDGTPPERWASPSPCKGWLARDVVAHVVDYSAHVLRETVGMSQVPAFADFDDPVAAFRGMREEVERVLDDPGTPPDVANYVDLAVSLDLPQHGWDLAKATGQDTTIDPDEVGLLWSSLSRDTKAWGWQRDNGWYAAAVPVPEDAPLQDRVLGLLGRNPEWEAPRGGRPQRGQPQPRRGHRRPAIPRGQRGPDAPGSPWDARRWPP